MSMTAKSVLDRVQRLLHDVGEDRWPRSTLLEYLSDAQQALVSARPDATAEVRNLQLTATAMQEIPEDAYAFLGAIRNMGTDGMTPGPAIRNRLLAEKETADPAWDDALTATNVREAVYDDMTPRVFWVSPIPQAAVYIAARVSVMPAALEDEATDVLAVSEAYRQTLVLWTAASAYEENTDAGSLQLAQQYRATGLQLIGVKAQADQKVTVSATGPVGQPQ